MDDHAPSWPRCACDRCFAAAARAVIGGALPAIVGFAFSAPRHAPAPPPRKPAPRRQASKRRAPARRAPDPPPVVAAPTRTCRVCGDTSPAGWAQADLCLDSDCLSAAAKAGRERIEAQRAPTVARAKRLTRIAKVAGRRDRAVAEAERAELADDHDEDLVDRLDRVPEVMP